MAEDIKTIYTDGIGKIHFFGNMIRMDLMDFVPDDSNDNSKPTPQITHRVVMSPNAFLASYESFVNMIDKLTKAGVLTTAENAREGDTPAEAAPIESAAKVEDVK